MCRPGLTPTNNIKANREKKFYHLYRSLKLKKIKILTAKNRR